MHLTTEPIDLSELLRRVQSFNRGGVASFLGTVRDHQSGRTVERLEYSAYAPMAEAECARIVAEAESRWDCSVALNHRLGTLAVGEIAVAIAAAAAHRDAAFAACRYVIEEVKRRAPIWKREVYADGSVDWVSGYADMGVSEGVAEPTRDRTSELVSRAAGKGGA